MFCVKCLSRPTTQKRTTNSCVLQTVDTAPCYGGRSGNNHNRHNTFIISYCCRSSYIQSKFCTTHRHLMNVWYSKVNAYVPTFSRFRIPLRRHRPHEPSSRLPCKPSLGAVGWRARWRKKQTKTSATSREKGREARRALGFPLLQRYDFGFATVPTLPHAPSKNA